MFGIFYFTWGIPQIQFVMNIIINGKSTDVKAANISELAAELGLPEKGVAIAVSNKMVPRTEWESTALSANDNVVIIKAACGG